MFHRCQVAIEVGRLGKDVARSDMAKDAAAGATIGAVIAMPVPFIGPLAGAVVGASIGVYKNVARGAAPPVPDSVPPSEPSTIIELSAAPSSAQKFDDLNRLYELNTKGVLTEEEFIAEKRKILDQ